MSTVTRVMDAPPSAAWDVLCDGWLYPLWVVGATRMREVDDDWPAVGAKLHHSVGSWPVMLDDTTSVTECTPGRTLGLRARAWPTGEAQVVLRLEEGPEPGSTTVTIEEDAVRGAGTLVPSPLRQASLHLRNVEALRRLAFLVERRAS